MIGVSHRPFSSPEQLGFICNGPRVQTKRWALGTRMVQSFYVASVGDSVYEFGCAETLMMTHEALGLVDEVIIHTFIDRKKS